MKPPICGICGAVPDERSGERFETIAFRRTAADVEWYRRAEAPGFVGHPPNVEWFCPRHVDRARALTDLTVSEALVRLRSQQSGSSFGGWLRRLVGRGRRD